jgi:hypothetical protein
VWATAMGATCRLGERFTENLSFRKSLRTSDFLKAVELKLLPAMLARPLSTCTVWFWIAAIHAAAKTMGVNLKWLCAC